MVENVIKIKSGIRIKIESKCRCECKKHDLCEKDYIWNPATRNCENGKYLASIQQLRGMKL